MPAESLGGPVPPPTVPALPTPPAVFAAWASAVNACKACSLRTVNVYCFTHGLVPDIASPLSISTEWVVVERAHHETDVEVGPFESWEAADAFCTDNYTVTGFTVGGTVVKSVTAVVRKRVRLVSGAPSSLGAL